MNATRAAKEAGYSERTAYSQGQRLLKNVEIKTRIAVLLERATRKNEVTLDWIMREMVLLASSGMKDFEHRDLLGSAYEYLVYMFAESAGKKGGEFY
jgi:phage terminase small subunit